MTLKLNELRSRAETFLHMVDVKDCDMKALEQLIEELKQLQKTTKTLRTVREIEVLLIPLEKLFFKVSEGDNDEVTSKEIKQFKNYSKIIEASLQQKSYSRNKNKFYEGIIKEMRKLLPLVPLNLVNQTSTKIVKYIELQQELKSRSEAMKTVRKAERVLKKKFISPSGIKRLMMKMFTAERYFKCNSHINTENQNSLEKIESLKGSLAATLSYAYIIDQCQKMLTMSVTHMSKFNIGMLMKNLGTIIVKSENDYLKITARELRIELREKFMKNQNDLPSEPRERTTRLETSEPMKLTSIITEHPLITMSSELLESTTIAIPTSESDQKLFQNLSKLMRNEMKKFDVEKTVELQRHYEQLKEIHEKIPSHSGTEFTSITNEFDTYKSIVDNFQTGNEILHNISHSLKHDNLTEEIIDNQKKLLNKAEEYLKTYHEHKNLNDTSYILQHKIELAGAQTSVNTINLAHEIITMEKEDYEKVHNSSVKDVLRSLEVITEESENEFLRTSANEVMVLLRTKMQAFYEHMSDLLQLAELENIKVTLKNKTAIGGHNGLLKLNTSLAMLENSIKMHNISEKVLELRITIEAINQIFLTHLEILREIEDKIHIPVNQSEADQQALNIPILQKIIDSEYPDLKISSKAKELKELIIVNFKDFHIAHQIKKINMTLGEMHQSWVMGKNGIELKQSIKTLDGLESEIIHISDIEEHHKEDIQKILNDIAKMKRLIPMKTAKVAIKKNAVILLKIVEQFINEMSMVGKEIDEIENELQILEKFDSNQIDISTLKDRKRQIVNDYGRILNDLQEVKEELMNMDLPMQSTNATEIFGKDNVTMSDVIDTLVRLDNLLRDESTSSLYKATFRNMQELEHIESAIEQMKKMISRLKKYVKIPSGNATENIESTSTLTTTTINGTETSEEDNAESTEINHTNSSSIEETTTIGNTNEENSITEAEHVQQQQQQEEEDSATKSSTESTDPNETQTNEVINSTLASVK